MINPKKRILVVLAHPDDESFAIGGTLAKYSRQGMQVVLLTATRGEAGIPGKEPEESGKIRERELRKAAKHLGIEVHFLNYLDGELANEAPIGLIEQVAGWIDTVQPHAILTFGPDGVSGHPDHVTISKIVSSVVKQYFPSICLFYIAPSEATELGCGIFDSKKDLDESLFAIDISDYKLEKVRAIQSHISQHPPLTGKEEEDIEKIPCSEYFTIANNVNHSKNIDDCLHSEIESTHEIS